MLAGAGLTIIADKLRSPLPEATVDQGLIYIQRFKSFT
jgi:hypothetical protein